MFAESEDIQFDMEKLFLLSVSKENFVFRGKLKNIPDRYLKVRIELELDKEETRTEVESRLSQIKYNLQTLLSGQRVKDVNGPKNKEALRKSMIRRANAALGGIGRITEVWPSEWVVQ